MPATTVIEEAGTGESFAAGQLIPGDYCIKVFDGNGCLTLVHCFTVPEAQTIMVQTQTVNATCAAGGMITIAATGGAGGFTYHWNDNATSAVRNDLALGTYQVTVTDANGCSTSISDLAIADDCTSCQPPVVLTTQRSQSRLWKIKR